MFEIEKEHHIRTPYKELELPPISLGFRSGSSSRNFRKVSFFNFAANSIDFLLLLSVTFFVLIGLSLIHVLHLKSMDWMQFFIGFLCGFKFLQAFVRIYFGQSVGDWACGMKLIVFGVRPTRIMFHVLLNIGTGLVFFPVLAVLANRDILGSLTKVYLLQFTNSSLK